MPDKIEIERRDRHAIAHRQPVELGIDMERSRGRVVARRLAAGIRRRHWCRPHCGRSASRPANGRAAHNRRPPAIAVRVKDRSFKAPILTDAKFRTESDPLRSKLAVPLAATLGPVTRMVSSRMMSPGAKLTVTRPAAACPACLPRCRMGIASAELVRSIVDIGGGQLAAMALHIGARPAPGRSEYSAVRHSRPGAPHPSSRPWR